MPIVRNLMVRATADFSDLNAKMKSANQSAKAFNSNMQKNMGGVKSSIGGVVTAIGVMATALVGLGVALSRPVQDAMEYEVALNNLNKSLGDNADEFLEWSNSVGAAMGYSRLQSARTGSAYAMMIQQFSSGSKETLALTEQLMTATSVIASGTGRNIQDVFERIQSGMRGETDAIEDLFIYVDEGTMNSSTAFKQLGGGVKTFGSVADETLKRNIRLLSILEQATNQFGTTLEDSTKMRMIMFNQQLLNLRLALGQAFLPILNVVLPILTAFVSRLDRAMQKVAQFFRAVVGKKGEIPAQTKDLKTQNETFKKQSSAIDNVSDSVKKLGKARQKASRGVLGFDEVNILPSASGGDGGDVGGGGDVFSDLNNAIDETNKKLDENKKKTEDIGYSMPSWLKPISDAWHHIVDACSDLWDALVNLANTPFIKSFFEDLAYTGRNLGVATMDILANSIEIIADLIQLCADVLNGDWSGAWETTKELMNDVYDLFSDLLEDIFPFMKKDLEDGKQWWIDLGNTAKDKWKEFTDFLSTFKWSDAWKGFQDYWTNTIVPWFKTDVVGKFKEHLVGKDGISGGTIFNNLKLGWEGIKEWFISGPVYNVKSAFANISGGTLFTNLKNGWMGISTWFTENPVKWVKNSFSAIKGSMLFENLKSGWNGLSSWFTTNVANPLKKVFTNITSGLGTTITNAFKTTYNKAIGFINSMIASVNKFGDSIDKYLDGDVIKHIPSIPKLAQGGIVGANSPMLAMIGDNKTQSEVVAPLDDLMGMITNAITTAMTFQNNQGGNQLGGDINISIDGRNFARVINPYLASESKRIGSNVRLQEI